MGRRIKLTHLSLLSEERDEITVWTDHIATAQAHEDGGTWINAAGEKFRVAETLDEIDELIRAAW